MIRLTGVEGKVFVLDLVSDMEGTISLTGGISKDVDENICTLEELKYIETSFKTKRVSMSGGDFSKVVERIAALSSSSGGGAVSSVNGEIGDVVIDASEIELTSGGSIETKFGELNPVAFSGNYLDLSDRPSFTVIDWDPYNVGSQAIPLLPGNTSTTYSSGLISHVNPPSIETFYKNVGDANSSEIVFTNGTGTDLTNIQITPTGGDLSKGFCFRNFKSLSVRPVDTFAYDGTSKISSIYLIIVPLEVGEDILTMSLTDIVYRPQRIAINITNLYQNDNNNYTKISASGFGTSTWSYEPTTVSGDYSHLDVYVEGNYLRLANDSVDLTTLGFDMSKPLGAVGSIVVDSTSFDVATPYNITIGEVKSAPKIVADVPGEFEIGIHKDEGLVLYLADDLRDPTEAFYFIVDEVNDLLACYTRSGGIPITATYIDESGFVWLKYNGTEFSLKNTSTGLYDVVYTKSATPFMYFSITDSIDILRGTRTKTSWNMTINSFSHITLLNGVLPGNANDGSTIKVTNNGLFDNVELKTGDIVTPYSNKTKLLLHRITQPTIVSSDVATAGTNAVSGEAVTSFVNEDYGLNVVSGKLHVAVSPFGDNILQKTADGLYVPTPAIPTPQAIASNLQSSTTEVVNGTGLSVKRSTDSGNSLEFRSNGVYVPTVTAPILDYGLPYSETGRAPSSNTVFNTLNSSTLYVTGGKAEVKLSTQQPNKLTYNVTGLHVAPEVRSTSVGLGDYNLLESNTVYNVLNSDTLSIVSNKTNVKIENPASSSVQINRSVNGISAVLKNIVKLGSVRETVSYSMSSGYRSLSLTNFNIFVIDCAGGSGTVALNGLNDLDGDQAKTITIIVKNTTALTWAAEFAWVDNIPPILQPSTTLVVTGVYASNASNATYTAGKILCTFSYFTI